MIVVAGSIVVVVGNLEVAATTRVSLLFLKHWWLLLQVMRQWILLIPLRWKLLIKRKRKLLRWKCCCWKFCCCATSNFLCHFAFNFSTAFYTTCFVFSSCSTINCSRNCSISTTVKERSICTSIRRRFSLNILWWLFTNVDDKLRVHILSVPMIFIKKLVSCCFHSNGSVRWVGGKVVCWSSHSFITCWSFCYIKSKLIKLKLNNVY